MRLRSVIVLALFTLPLAAAGGSDPCVPKGQTKDVKFDLPDPGDEGVHGVNEGADHPTGHAAFEWGSWRKHPSSAFEGDPITPDDPMGKVDPSQDSVSVPVKNDGGDLSGPNQDVQNGPGEGDCIEVYVEVSYRIWTRTAVSITTTFAPEGIGTSKTETQETWEWVYYTYETKEKEVCPC